MTYQLISKKMIERIMEKNKFERIVPVECKKEEIEFVERMYCPKCKTSHYCNIIYEKKKEEENHTYNLTIVRCNYCFAVFPLKFYNEEQLNRFKKQD